MSTILKAKVRLVLIAVVAASCGCNDEPVKLPPTDLQKINIGHAGSGFNYLFNPFNPLPPNSFTSLTNALANGAGGVEVDLQITADHQLVLFHDVTLESKSDLKGNVAHLKSDEVIGAPFRCGFPYDFFHEDSIISFKRWIHYAMSLSPVPFLQVDIKSSHGQTESLKDSMIYLMIEELREVNYPADKVIAISPDQVILTKLMQADSTLICAYEPPDFATGLAWVTENNCRYLIMDHKDLSAESVQSAHDKEIGVIAFGGKSGSTLKKILKMNPDFIQSNNVKLLNEILNNQ